MILVIVKVVLVIILLIILVQLIVKHILMVVYIMVLVVLQVRIVVNLILYFPINVNRLKPYQEVYVGRFLEQVIVKQEYVHITLQPLLIRLVRCF